MKKLSFMLALAVLTFGFIATVTSCHNGLTGTDSQEISVFSITTGKKINVYFNVKNGGMGLTESNGEVRTYSGSYHNSKHASFANNFSISLLIPSRETYVIIYWNGGEAFSKGWTYLSAKLYLTPGVSDYEILLDYNGDGRVVTEGLKDVYVWYE